MKSLSILIVLIGVACVYSADNENPNADPEYRAFKKEYGISYRSKAKEQEKYAQFKRNKAKIEDHNAKYQAGEETYAMDINQFGDSTLEEVAQNSFGLVPPPPADDEEDQEVVKRSADNLATPLKESWDWRSNNGVTPVKNQKSCGSCWAFSTAGVVESQILIKLKKNVSLSEQNLVNCAGETYNSAGCNGGWPESVLKYVRDIGAVADTSCPYTAKDGTCKSVTGSVYGKSGTIRSVRSKDVTTVKNAIYTYGPCTAALYVGDDLVHYKNGTFSNKADVGGTPSVNHAVIIVGYGKDQKGIEYWIVKNSWGSTWGDKGFFNVAVYSDEKTKTDHLQIGKYVVCYEMKA